MARTFSFLPLWAGVLSLAIYPSVALAFQEVAPVPGSVDLGLQSEFRVRRFSLDPGGTRAEWKAMLGSSQWLQVYDVLDAMQRNPEAARWFCRHEKQSLRGLLEHERSAVRAAAWRVVRMGQDEAKNCVDWADAGHSSGPLAEEGRAWFEAALSESTIGASNTRELAYRAVLEVFATHRNDSSKCAVALAGVGFDELGFGAWWQGEGAAGSFRGLRPADLRVPTSNSTMHALRERARGAPMDVRFQVEALALTQFALAGQPDSGLSVVDWATLQQGLVLWPADAELQVIYDRLELLDAMSLLGVPALGRFFWQVAMDPSAHLSPEGLAVLGGEDSARYTYLAWSVNSATPEVSIARSLKGGQDLQLQVWGALEGDVRDIPFNALRPWLEERIDSELQSFAVGRLWSMPSSEGRRSLLLKAVENCRGEALRLAFRALAKGHNKSLVQESLHRIWRQRDAEEQMELLRELPNSGAWKAFSEDWLETVRELGPSGLLEFEHLSYLAMDPRWQALFERDFTEAFDQRMTVWESGHEPVSRDLARRAQAVQRVQYAGESTGPDELSKGLLARSLLRRVDWLRTLSPEELDGVRFDFSKACVALLAKDPRFAAWVRGHLVEIQTWPGRLRVEVALGLAPQAYSNTEDPLHGFVAELASNRYERLGDILKERWLAEGSRGRSLFAAEAANRRASSNVRQVAMAGLASLGEVQTLVGILNQDKGVTGPQLAMEALLLLEGEPVDRALRDRWKRAQVAAAADGPEREVESHLELELFLVLVQRGILLPVEIEACLAGPMAQRFIQLEQRMKGAATEEGWRPQLRLVQHLARQGKLSELLAGQPGWSALDGRFLGKLAQAAWGSGDLDSAGTLARWAEVALAGEPNSNRWWSQALGVRILRYQLARRHGDLANTAWYSERLLEDLLGKRQGAIRVEDMLGGFDLRAGRHPIAFLSALRLQSLAMGAAVAGDEDRARVLLERAEPFCESSRGARAQQERAARWVQDR